MRVNEVCDILGKNSANCEGGSMMEKRKTRIEVLPEIKKTIKDFAKENDLIVRIIPIKETGDLVISFETLCGHIINKTLSLGCQRNSYIYIVKRLLKSVKEELEE